MKYYLAFLALDVC